MSALERMQIASGMLDAARDLLLASLPAHWSNARHRHVICERFYGSLADEVFGKQS